MRPISGVFRASKAIIWSILEYFLSLQEGKLNPALFRTKKKYFSGTWPWLELHSIVRWGTHHYTSLYICPSVCLCLYFITYVHWSSAITKQWQALTNQLLSMAWIKWFFVWCLHMHLFLRHHIRPFLLRWSFFVTFVNLYQQTFLAIFYLILFHLSYLIVRSTNQPVIIINTNLMLEVNNFKQLQCTCECSNLYKRWKSAKLGIFLIS